MIGRTQLKIGLLVHQAELTGNMVWSWKFLEGLLVAGAIALALAVWFLPNFAESDKMHAIEDAVKERREQRLAYEAEQKRLAEESKEKGLVYFGPGGVPIIEGDATP